MIRVEYKTEKDMKKTKKKNHRKVSNVQKRRKIQRYLRIGLILLVVLLIILMLIKIFKPSWLGGGSEESQEEKFEAIEPEIDVELLTVNPYSRPGQPTDKIKGIVVHYTANPGASAIDNRDYFEGLKDSHTTQASSNFIIGLEGEIIQCVPTWEVAYASNERNIDTVSIECCHPDESGKFNDETYRSMVQLCAWLCMKFELNEDDIIRHHDVTGKNCPKYFVENEEAWKKFKKDVGRTLADF
jgi:N-acetyl-anhydromuramyl-L-alanine amidase AmpD